MSQLVELVSRRHFDADCCGAWHDVGQMSFVAAAKKGNLIEFKFRHRFALAAAVVVLMNLPLPLLLVAVVGRTRFCKQTKRKNTHTETWQQTKRNAWQPQPPPSSPPPPSTWSAATFSVFCYLFSKQDSLQRVASQTERLWQLQLQLQFARSSAFNFQ